MGLLRGEERRGGEGRGEEKEKRGGEKRRRGRCGHFADLIKYAFFWWKVRI